MARGKGGLSSNVVLVTTRPKRAASMPASEHVHYSPSYTAPSLTTSRVSRATSHALDESEALSHQSRRNDQRLLDDITSRLCRFEYDNVKPGIDVSLKTSFRKLLYDKIRPKANKEAKAQRRRDELLYPWDYTKENLYHRRHKPEAPKRRKKEEKPKEEEEPKYEDEEFFDDEEEQILTAYDEWKIKKKKEKEELQKLKEQELEEKKRKPKDVDHYPIHDPYGLYRPKEERKHYKLEDIYMPRKDVEKKGTAELLANLKIKSLAMPRGRSPTKDVDYVVNQLSQPLPRSQSLYNIPDNVYILDYEKPPLGDETARKIKESRAELNNFEKLLNTTFNQSQAFKARQYARAAAQPIARLSYLDDHDDVDYDDYDLGDDESELGGAPYYGYGQRELGVEDDMDDYTPRQVAYRPPVAPVRSAARTGFYRGGQPGPSRRHYQSPGPVRRPVEIEVDNPNEAFVEVHSDHDWLE